MAGDEIVADWLGDTLSGYVNPLPNNSVYRISPTPLRVKSVHLYSGNSNDPVYAGKYYSALNTCRSFAFQLQTYRVQKFEFVDLSELGFTCYVGSAIFKWIAINRY